MSCCLAVRPPPPTLLVVVAAWVSVALEWVSGAKAGLVPHPHRLAPLVRPSALTAPPQPVLISLRLPTCRPEYRWLVRVAQPQGDDHSWRGPGEAEPLTE
jgi:hypothetical protein